MAPEAAAPAAAGTEGAPKARVAKEAAEAEAGEGMEMGPRALVAMEAAATARAVRWALTEVAAETG